MRRWDSLQAVVENRTEAVKLEYRYIPQAVLLCVCALGIAVGVYQGIVAPLNPADRSEKITTELQSMEILKKAGVANEIHLYDEDLAAPQENENIRLIPREISQAQTTLAPETTAPESQDENSAEESTPTVTLPEQTQEDGAILAQKVTYEPKSYFWIKFAAAIAGTLLLAVVLREVVRRVRFRRTLALEPVEQVQRFFRQYVRRMRMLGFRRKPSETWTEYAQKTSGKLKISGLDFFTEVYLRARYGGIAPTQEEYRQMLCLARGFPAELRKSYGLGKYLRCYFQLHAGLGSFTQSIVVE